MFGKINPEVSVCIPVFNTEKYLRACLESVKNQRFPAEKKSKNFLEVIVVDDCSEGCENEACAREIVKRFAKAVDFKVNYIRHEINKGLVEARRTAVYESKGEYILILDSDDTLPEDAILSLYNKAVETGAEIVQGKADVLFGETVLNQVELSKDVIESRKKTIYERANQFYDGIKEGDSIFDDYLAKRTISGFLWGKLIKKELYLEAFNHIPTAYCIMGEDLFQYFWISYEAKKYAGLNKLVYNYFVNTGISSAARIEDLKHWEKICSTATVFTSIFTELEEKNIQLNDEQKNMFAVLCANYAANNIAHLENAVISELKTQAYEMLYDYWGEDYIKQILSMMSEQA